MNHSDYMKMPMDDLRAMCSARGLGKFTGQGAKMKMAGALVALDRQSGGAELAQRRPAPPFHYP
jgi:hypothetical protein